MMKIKIIVIKKSAKLEKNPSVSEAWQNDKNCCNRHRCKERGYWLVALSWTVRLSPAGLPANQRAPKAHPAEFVPKRRKSQHLVGSLSWLYQSWYVRLLVGWGCSLCRQEGTQFPEAECCQQRIQGSLPSPPLSSTHTHTHTLQATCRLPVSTLQWASRNTWPGGLRAVALVEQRMPSSRFSPS